MKENDSRMQNLFLMGTMMLFAGYLLSYGCPLNKRLWSPSFVLADMWSSGIVTSFAALCY